MRMFFLFWVALLVSVSVSNSGASFTLGKSEITAEAGLCAVIPCSFTPGYSFTPQQMVWYRCEPSKPRCGDSDIIFHTNKKNKKVQSEFKGRVSLLEPDVNQGICSIIINDLTESDSGSYQFRHTRFLFGIPNGYEFSSRANVSVKDLMQKPTVTNPPLTAGQQTTLTCTAPGLCSGSHPKITWTWSGTGEYGSHIRGNFTAFNTENLTAVTQRHSSSLTFNSSVIHHGTNITCQVSFTGDMTTEETVTLNVTLSPEILNNSGCAVQSEVLTCVCISVGIPLPTIKWPLLENYAAYSVTTTVSNHTVTSTVTLTVKDLSNTVVQCVSSNVYGAAKEDLAIQMNTSEQQEDHHGPSALLPWTVAAVSLFVNVFFLIYVMFLWNTRKKVKPNQEDRTYMSLQKPDPSPEYDVIG